MPRYAEYCHRAALIEDRILSFSPFNGSDSAAAWDSLDVAHGASGTALYLLWAADHANAMAAKARLAPSTVVSSRVSALRAGAVSAAQWLLGQAEQAPHDKGLRWRRGPDTDGTHEGLYFPTFCCGTAGIGYMPPAHALYICFYIFFSCILKRCIFIRYMLSELSQREWVDHTLRQRLLAAAEGAATHLLALANTTINGTLVSLRETLFCVFVCVERLDVRSCCGVFALHAQIPAHTE